MHRAEVEELAGPQLDEEASDDLQPLFGSFGLGGEQLVLLRPSRPVLGEDRRLGWQTLEQGEQPPRFAEQVPRIQPIEPLKVRLEEIPLLL